MLQMARGLQWGWGYAAGLNSTQGLEFAAGVEHAPGKAGYPCQLIYYTGYANFVQNSELTEILMKIRSFDQNSFETFHSASATQT